MPFALHREQDVTGVSGTGTVAHGVRFADGRVVIRWLGDKPSTVMWDSLDDAMSVHGHDGKTQVVWLAAEFSEMALAEHEAASTERERIRELAIAHDARYRKPVYTAVNTIPPTMNLRTVSAPFADLLDEPPATMAPDAP